MNIFQKQIAANIQESNLWRPASGMLILLLFFCGVPDVQAQRLAVRTNVPEWFVSSPNVGLEFTLNSKLSLDMTGALCPVTFKKDLYYKHIRCQSEIKYWFENILSRHYVGLMGYYSSFDIGVKRKGCFGDSYAFGITYGYNWVISRRWNFELSAGLGAIRYRIDRYTPPAHHSSPNETGWIAAPIKLGASFVYIIK